MLRMFSVFAAPILFFAASSVFAEASFEVKSPPPINGGGIGTNLPQFHCEIGSSLQDCAPSNSLLSGTNSGWMNSSEDGKTMFKAIPDADWDWPKVQISKDDGTAIRGKVIEVDENTITLKTSFGEVKAITKEVFCEGLACPSSEVKSYNYGAKLEKGTISFEPNSIDSATQDLNIKKHLESAAKKFKIALMDSGIRENLDLQAAFLVNELITQPVNFIEADANATLLKDPVLLMLDKGDVNLRAFNAVGTPKQNFHVKISDTKTVAGLSVARLREIARQAANELFTETAEQACTANPRPKEITPSVSVSFNLFAGAEFGISATFDVVELCTKKF